MSRYLMAVAIGPVQDFIAAARRSRDLWFGSYLLSEVSKAAALALQREGATLIFPAPLNDNDLAPDSALNVANKLLAEVATEDVAGLAASVKASAHQRWSGLAAQTLAQLRKKSSTQFKVDFHVRDELWQEQVGDVLDVFSAWVQLNDQNYGAAYQRVDALLKARKNTREFLPTRAADHAFGVPKSSLDGKRESVLPKELPKWVKRRMGLSAGEQLDCPGVVKRLGTKPDDADAARFTSISRIALDPWLRGIDAEGGNLPLLHRPLRDLIDDGLVSRVSGNQGEDGELPYARLPFDGQLLFPFRLEAQFAALDKEAQEIRKLSQAQRPLEPLNTEAVKERLHRLRTVAQPFWRDYGEPCPYVAVLHADGDRMGELLGSLTQAGQHRQVSQALARFAQKVPDVVRDYYGHCIYSGGDDVLALVPLDGVIGCARALYESFCATLSLPFSDIKPTLSVGIAIGHLLEPMGNLLDLAREAERLAKGDSCPQALRRDALAVILQPRSGARIAMRGRWQQQPDERLQGWIGAFQRDDIPDKAPYELHELARQLNWAPAELVEKEMRRILQRKQAGSGTRKIQPALQNQLVQAIAREGMPADRALADLVAELLIARRLSRVALRSSL